MNKHEVEFPRRSTRTRRIVLAVLVGVLGVAFVIGGLLLVIKPWDNRLPQGSTVPTWPTNKPSGSSGGTRNKAGANSNETSATGTVIDLIAQTPQGGRAAAVAFRSGKNVSVFAEDGSGSASVIPSVSGPYALSPDGQTLALVQDHILYLVDVQTRDVTPAGDADTGLRPQWQPDSSRVVFRRRAETGGEGYEIWSVQRNGTRSKRLLFGEKAAWSSSGEVLVILNTAGPDVTAGGGSVSVSINGSVFRTFPIQGAMPTAVGSNGRRVFAGVTDGGSGTKVLSMALDGTDRRQITAAVPGERLAFWSGISASPDGGLLALQADGDDGYARSFLVPAEGGKLTGLTRLSDTTVHGFTVAGDRLFLVEGNAFQGEQTSLISVGRDGSGRKSVVSGE